jgi:hypothetical protein
VTSRALVLTGLAVLVALTIGSELVARRGRWQVRPLGTALTAALRTPAGRVGVLAVWLWLGWHFLAR